MKIYLKISVLCIVLLLSVQCSKNVLEPGFVTTSNFEMGMGLSTATISGQLYSYYFGEKVYFNEREDLVYLEFSDIVSLHAFYQNYVSGSEDLQVFTSNSLKGGSENEGRHYIVVKSSSSNIKQEDIVLFRKVEGVLAANRMIESDGRLSAPTSIFYAMLKNRADYSTVSDLAEKYGCVISRKKFFGSELCLITVPSDSEVQSLSLANRFYETGLFEFTSPDLFYYDISCSSDPYFDWQWNLYNTGQFGGRPGVDINIHQAWGMTRGSGDVVIAVLDDGVELNHPDLASNIVAGYDCITHSSGGSPVYDDPHGTSVAGIIAAKSDNEIGIVGVAPGCKLMPVRVSSGNSSICQYIIDGFQWAVDNGADVINASWSLGLNNAVITYAIEQATIHGRNGKGCVVVFAAGNTRDGDHNQVSYPASLYCVISVGAIDQNGRRVSFPNYTWSSNYGVTLDVVAPGDAIATTDLQAGNGYNANGTNDFLDNNFTKHFNGTSAAAPHVSGIAALILSEYPDLPESYVRRSIEAGADKLSGYYYTEDNQYPYITRNNEVGYGLVNAFNAIAAASQADIQNTLDGYPGFDFTIINNSSYQLDDVIIDVRGNIGGSDEYLVSSDIFFGVPGGRRAGYPSYRGLSMSSYAGSNISNVTLDLFASCLDCPGVLSVGVSVDNPTPTTYSNFYFGMGDSFQTTIPITSIPVSGRRMIYVTIYDVY